MFECQKERVKRTTVKTECTRGGGDLVADRTKAGKARVARSSGRYEKYFTGLLFILEEGR